MGVVTVVPDTTRQAGGYWSNVGGAANVHTALSDNLDTTYVESTHWVLSTYLSYSPIVGFANPVGPAASKIAGVRLRMRAVDPGATKADRARARPYLEGKLGNGITSAGLEAAITEYTGGWETTRPNGGVWTQADLDALEAAVLLVDQYGDGAVRVHQLWLDVDYNERPFVTVGTVTGVDSTRPTVAWSHTDPEGDPQESYQVKVFTAAQYGAAGFNPETSTAAWDSAKTLSPVQSVQVGADLTLGAHRAYVKVWQPKVAGQDHPSEWAFAAFTIDFPPPATPTTTATPEVAQARIAVGLRSNDNFLTYDQSTLEGGVAGWAAGTNAEAPVQETGAGNFVTPGAASLRMTAAVTAGVAGDMSYRTASTFVAPPVGETCVARAKFKAATTARQVGVAVEWRNASGTVLGTDTSPTVADGPGGFTEVAFVTPGVPAGATQGHLVLRVLGCAAGEVHYGDHLGVFYSTNTAWSRGGVWGNSTAGWLLEYSDDAGATWKVLPELADRNPVRPFGTTGLLTVHDYETAPGATRRYRAKAQATINDILLASDWSTTAQASVATGLLHLKDPLDPSRNLSFDDAGDLNVVVFRFHHRKPRGVSDPLGRYTAVPVTEGTKGIEGTMGFRTRSKAAYDALRLLLHADRTLLFQRPFGDQFYLDFGESDDWELVKAQDPTGTFAVRHLHEVTYPVVEVERP